MTWSELEALAKRNGWEIIRLSFDPAVVSIELRVDDGRLIARAASDDDPESIAQDRLCRAVAAIREAR